MHSVSNKEDYKKINSNWKGTVTQQITLLKLIMGCLVNTELFINFQVDPPFFPTYYSSDLGKFT